MNELFTSWWGRIGLQLRLQILVQGSLIVLLVSAQLWFTNQLEHQLLDDTRDQALEVADGVINGLNTLMVTKVGKDEIISDKKVRALFIQKMGASEKIKELRVIRANQIGTEFSDGLPQEQAVDDLDRSVLNSGKTEFRISKSGENDWLRTVVPFIARRDFRTTNCLKCHNVEEGAVLGAASIVIDVTDKLTSINKIKSWIWLGQGTLQGILFFIIGFIVRRLVRQLGGEPAYVIDIVTQISKGNLTQKISKQPSDSTSLLAAIELMQEKRKQAEDAVEEKRVQLADILNFLPDATLAIDKDKRVIIWNKAIEKMTGIPANDMIGKGGHAYTIPFYGEARTQLMDLIFQDSREITSRYPNITREGDCLSTVVFCNALYNNTGAWVFAKASPLHDHSGKVIGAIEIIRDITVFKKTEAALDKYRLHLEDTVASRTSELALAKRAASEGANLTKDS